MPAPVRTVAPEITPVSLAEVKAHLHVDHSDDDAMLGALLAAAVEHFDGWTGILGRCLVEQTWRQDFDVACQVLRLPLAPVISIASITYPDANGGQVTIDSADYALKVDVAGCASAMLRAEAVPSGPISVTYVAGYATTPADGETPAQSTVPEPLKLAIILRVKSGYDPLEPAVRDSYQRAIDDLVAPLRRVGV